MGASGLVCKGLGLFVTGSGMAFGSSAYKGWVSAYTFELEHFLDDELQ